MGLFGKKEKKPTGDNFPKGAELLNTVAKALDGVNFQYEKNLEKRIIKVTVKGDDLPIPCFIHTYDDSARLAFDCPLDFTVPEGKESVILRKINDLNESIHYGCFTLVDGRVWYRYHAMPYGQFDEAEIIGLYKMVVDTVDEVDGDMASMMTRSSSQNVMYN